MDPREDVLKATWLASRYQVAGLRARGALCLVYQGQDAVLQRPVAVKAPLAEHANTYRATLALTATLAHPAFLALYDVIEQGDGLFLAYEFVEGRPLGDYIATGLPLRRALAIMLQVTRALAYAHAHSVAHGDLTPAAILVDRAAVARVSNVGLVPDGAYFDNVSTCAYASGVADDPDTTASLLSENIERLDTWAVATMLWQLVTDADAARNDASSARLYRADTPNQLRDVIERSLRITHSEAITTAESLEAELAALDAALALDVSEAEEAVPATISALRAGRQRAAEAGVGAADIPGMRWHGAGAAVISPTATTSYGESYAEGDPYITHPSEDVPYEAVAPRLRLPARPAEADKPRPFGAAYAASPAQRPRQADVSGGLGGWVWALISLAVFTLCFLSGFFLTPLIPLPHLP